MVAPPDNTNTGNAELLIDTMTALLVRLIHICLGMANEIS